MSATLVKAGALAEQVRGVSYGKEDASDSRLPGYLPILRAGNITDEGLVYDDLVFVPKERVSEKQKIRRHDVVIAASSGSLDIVGKAAASLADFDGSFGAFCKVLRPNARVHPGYFAHFFKTLDYRRRVSALAAGANINNLRNEHLDDMEVPLPPLLQQQRIAEVLDRAEALRAKRRAALAQLDSLTQSLFLDLFGDPATSPTKFSTARLGTVTTFIDYRGISPNKQSSGVRLVTARNIKRGWFEDEPQEFIPTDEYDSWMTRGIPAAGDVLFTTEGHTLGSAALLPIFQRAALAQRLIALHPREKLRPEYLLNVVLDRTFQNEVFRRATGSAARGISSKQLAEILVPIPPIELQREFARRVAAVEKLKTAQRASLTELDSLFASLQHRAFRGEL